jgi:hypothetical protein
MFWSLAINFVTLHRNPQKQASVILHRGFARRSSRTMHQPSNVPHSTIEPDHEEHVWIPLPESPQPDLPGEQTDSDLVLNLDHESEKLLEETPLEDTPVRCELRPIPEAPHGLPLPTKRLSFPGAAQGYRNAQALRGKLQRGPLRADRKFSALVYFSSR